MFLLILPLFVLLLFVIHVQTPFVSTIFVRRRRKSYHQFLLESTAAEERKQEDSLMLEAGSECVNTKSNSASSECDLTNLMSVAGELVQADRRFRKARAEIQREINYLRWS